jgi:xanthine dehydrogenase accessory factor
MFDIYDQLKQLRDKNMPAALVTVIATKGSTPRDTGTKMIICGDGKVFGTIGGSAVEAIVIEEARECLKKNLTKKVWHDLDDKNNADTGMICGGKMEFFIEPLMTAPHLFIFGGGHVALPLSRFASMVGFSYTIVEDRQDFASIERFPNANEIIRVTSEEIDQKIKISASDYIAIVSRSHELDFLALKKTLKHDFKYLGLIASKIKKKQIFARLKEEGFKESAINRIHSPIGLDISAQTPEEIAISIVAELIQIKNNSGK